ncbi:MAG: c-type cytochrome [Myxococcota bacterium]
MRALRVIGFFLLGVFVVMAAAAVIGHMRFAQRRDKKHNPPSFVVKTADDPETLARGEHIARTIGGCAECHGADFGGQMLEQDPMFVMAPPNITAGKGSVVRDYHGDDWLRAIAYGVHRDGRSLIAMPSEELGKISDEDLSAVVSYLSQVPPVDREVTPTRLTALGSVVLGLMGAPIFAAEVAANRKAPETTPEPGETRAYGKYLIAVCHGCHGPALEGGIATHPGAPISADISPSAMAAWTFDELEAALRQGKRKSGGVMNPNEMPWGMTKQLTASEMRAVWLALRNEGG